MNRRGFLAGLAATAATVPRAWGIQAGQEPAPPTGAGQGTGQQAPTAGRLYNPDVVQERARGTALDNDEFIMSVEKKVRCTCGCNLDVYTCRTTDFTCTTSPAMHREVLALYESGADAEGILAAFTARYGEDVLMAPRPEGFNLAGYLVPGILITLIGGALAVVLYRRQLVLRVADAAGGVGSAIGPATVGAPVDVAGTPTPAPAIEATPEELERLQQALREADG